MIEILKSLIKKALLQLDIEADIPVTIERSRRPDHGHYTSNIALVLARPLKQKPVDIAQKIKAAMTPWPEPVDDVKIEGPGFINFFIVPEAFQRIVRDILDKASDFGRSNQGRGARALVEFVSANPTGPLTVGHGRQAVLGDCVARILEWNGYNVDREYYYNDAGRQMRILGQSVYIRYRQLLGFDDKLTDDHYQGEYIVDVARKIKAEYGEAYVDKPDDDIFRKSAEEAVFADIRHSLEELRIRFDSYYNEKSLYEDGRIDDVLNRLEEIGATYEKDGAIWFRAGDYGSDDDRVLWKSVVDEATYRLPDIAYHETKIRRGYDLIVDIFGADHHATYPDVLAGLRALGYETDRIRVLIHQFVTLTRGAEKVKMSTRKANYVTLSELVDEVGVDVVRYFFIMRGMKSHLNFDLELAKTEGDENPVFYLQYAHARICSILRNARIKGYSDDERGELGLLIEEETLALLNVLGEFEEICIQCGQNLEPQLLTTYLQKLAATFHKFYTIHRVITKDKTLSRARLDLVRAVKIVMANGLNLLGIDAPERM
ncbi:MAG: arginine--tRNA ligase [Candidatus Neomarinimicrobiota bacterium]|nr:MAG: arginine--tRNA ligase [Candidatus Neomarinimicrobiota bacterium]